MGRRTMQAPKMVRVALQLLEEKIPRDTPSDEKAVILALARAVGALGGEYYARVSIDEIEDQARVGYARAAEQVNPPIACLATAVAGSDGSKP